MLKNSEEIAVDEQFASFCQAARTNKSICPYGCSRLIAPRTIEQHRTQGCRGKFDEPIGEGDKRRSYLCGVCGQEFHTRRGFMTHMNDEHDVTARIHALSFSDKFMFDRFLHWLEAQGGAHFRLKSGAKRTSSGKRGTIYACNRSGFVETANTKRDFQDRDRMGPMRCGYTCTAYIQMIEQVDGTISVAYCGDHYGHDARLRIPNGVKNLIVRKALTGASNADIVQFLQYHFLPLTRESLVASRLCMLAIDEIRLIVAQGRKSFELTGELPESEDIWDEELLDKAGVERPWLKRRHVREKTIAEIAEEANWPVPSAFVGKQKSSATGEYRPVVHMVEALDAADHPVENEPIAKRRAVEARETTMSYCNDHIDYVEPSHHSHDNMMEPSTSQQDVADDVSEVFEEINVEDVEENDALMGNMSEGKDKVVLQSNKPQQPTHMDRAYLERTVLTEMEMLRTIVQNNLNYQTDVELHQLSYRLRALRSEFDSIGKRLPARVVDDATCSFYEETVDVEELDMNDLKRRPRIEIPFRKHSQVESKEVTTIKGVLFEDHLSDDEQIVGACDGAMSFRADIWN